jgi:hypothetical protein
MAVDVVTDNIDGYSKDWKINGEAVSLTVQKQ